MMSTRPGNASATPTLQGGNLANGLFTDFAPLLTLFGEEVTKQFLATSMGWGDDILLALAPIRIITMIISAIRVSGYPLMRSIIGRARDSPDDEEKDILSSTSTNVREIWTGQRIIRQSGESQTTEFVYTKRKEVKGISFFAGVWTLESALRGDTNLDAAYTGEPVPLYHIKTSPKWKAPWRCTTFRKSENSVAEKLNANNESPTCERVRLANNLIRRSPNLTLNVKDATPSEIQAWIFTFIGAFLQALVFAFNALVVYYYRWSRAGYVVASYGYPIWASGTICITIGVCLCARVVEYSMTESMIEPLSLKDGPSVTQHANASRDTQQMMDTTRQKGDEAKPDENTGFHVVRLQKKIPTMNLPAFAIFNDERNPRVVISRRNLLPPGLKLTSISSERSESEVEGDEAKSDSKSTVMAITTVTGTAFTLVGFVCQNIGTRELHWSGGVSQLGLTLMLVLLRAWMRRHVGDPPSKATALKTAFEASHLASDIHQVDLLTIHVGTYHNTEGAQSVDIPGDNIRLFPGQVSLDDEPQVVNLSRTTELDTAFDGRVMVHRALKSQILFSEIQSDSSEISDTATRVYETIEAILTLLEISDFFWCHKISVKGSPRFIAVGQPTSSVNPLEGLVNLELWAWKKVSSALSNSTISRRGCIEVIQAILSLTMYHYSKSREGKQDSKRAGKFLFIVGCCQAEDADGISFQQKQNAISRFILDTTGRWFRGSDGKVTPLECADPVGEMVYERTVFGMPYSAMKYNDLGEYCTPEGAVKFVVPILESRILKMFELDLVSNFLMQLVSRNEIIRDKLLSSKTTMDGGYWENDFLKELDMVLTVNGIGANSMGAILAAFLHHNVFPPDPESNDPSVGST